MGTMKDVPVSPYFLVGMHNQPHSSWATTLRELCDNSFDAGATRVEIQFLDKARLRVIDNGRGCKDLPKMFGMGVHMPHEEPGIGMYGVGFKDAATWLWGVTSAYSVCGDGFRYAACMDWERASRAPKLQIEEEDRVLANGQNLGMCLEFSRISKKNPPYQAILDELGYSFAPGLLAGKQIVLSPLRGKPMTCSAWTFPPLEKQATHDFSIHNRKVEVIAGILPEGVKEKRHGFNIAFQHRYITSTFLEGRDCTTTRVCGRVKLGPEWKPHLARNKDAIMDGFQELDDELYRYYESMIRESATQAQVLLNRELETAISEELNRLLGRNGKARRDGAHTKEGTVKPTGRGSRHRHATKVQPGNSIIEKARQCGIRCVWEPNDVSTVCRVSPAFTQIFMNENHPYLQQLRNKGNNEALAMLCLAHFCQAATSIDRGGQKCFEWATSGFDTAMSRILLGQQNGENI